ncbi:MAG: flavodoxin family protein [Candidatus Thorarchaeota archaeon SMTZ1-45]|nr:MAG: iron-sulfur flavoprotein [Candidatus Thorarchaeota archaeon SMTZ1-45]
MTNVLAINGSARMEKGYTHKVLTAFLEGMKEAKATVETVFAKRLKIRPCLGEFQCWFEKVGECIQRDDMGSLLPKLREADILILAIPVYLPLPGEMQNFLNRLMPIVEPVLEFHEGRTRAKFHDDVKISKIVLVSVGGWWEKDNLATVVRIVEDVARDANVEFSGAVLRPHAFLMDEHKDKAEEVLSAVKSAGFQLVKEGKISPETFEIISQPLIAEEELRARYNKMYLRAKESSS